LLVLVAVPKGVCRGLPDWLNHCPGKFSEVGLFHGSLQRACYVDTMMIVCSLLGLCWAMQHRHFICAVDCRV